MTSTHGSVRHFGINADDVDIARRFYGTVFGWTFEPWGPPEFFHIRTADGDLPGMHAALQRRRDLPGHRVVGFECTVAVDDVDAVAAAVRAEGGEILMEKTTIAGVGDLIWFADPSGNVVGAMSYHADAD
jgi:predicted enzyme related to lactoylglutathione lyase